MHGGQLSSWNRNMIHIFFSKFFGQDCVVIWNHLNSGRTNILSFSNENCYLNYIDSQFFILQIIIKNTEFGWWCFQWTHYCLAKPATSRGKVISQEANKVQMPFLANSIYSRDPISKMSINYRSSGCGFLIRTEKVIKADQNRETWLFYKDSQSTSWH